MNNFKMNLPFVKAVRVEMGDKSMALLSGYLGVNPKTLEFPGDDIGSQTLEALLGFKNLLEENGGSLKSIVKTNCFLDSMDYFSDFDKAFIERFGNIKPARSAYAVKGMALNARIELDAVAFTSNIPNEEVQIEYLDSSKCHKPYGFCSLATRLQLWDKSIIHTSMIIGYDIEIENFPKDDISSQSKQALINLKNLLEENESSLKNVSRANIYLNSIEDFSSFNLIYETYFSIPFPARTCFAVKELPLNAKIGIHVVAFSLN